MFRFFGRSLVPICRERLRILNTTPLLELFFLPYSLGLASVLAASPRSYPLPAACRPLARALCLARSLAGHPQHAARSLATDRVNPLMGGARERSLIPFFIPFPVRRIYHGASPLSYF